MTTRTGAIDGALYFAWEETAVSVSHPALAVPVPACLVSTVERQARLVLDPLRIAHGSALVVLSWYRSEALNRAVGGSPTSQHVMAEATDVTGKRITALFREIVSGVVPMAHAGQMIYYPDQYFIHAALPSKRYPLLSLHVHCPRRGLIYRRITDVAHFDRMVHG